MFGHYQYILSILIFAGGAILIEWIFGFHLLKKYLKPIGVAVVLFLLFTPLGESVALKWQNWQYHPETTLFTRFIGAEVETYLYAFFVAIAVASAVLAWTSYEDRGKPIIRESLKDVFKGTYAIWRKDPESVDDAK